MKRSELSRFEDLVRSGRWREVKGHLVAMNLAQVPRALSARVSGLARRVDMPGIGLRLLNPIVRGKKNIVPATDDEVTEYAACLQRIGAVRESLALLHGVREPGYFANLITAFCHFSQWRSDLAYPVLQKAVLAADKDSYEWCVANINLLAAQVEVREFESARPNLLELRARCEKSGYTVLAANCLEILSQIYFHSREFDQAEALLQMAVVDPAHRGIYENYTAKWLVLIRAAQDRPFADEAHKVREAARHLCHWETLRHLDGFLGVLTRDSTLLQRAWFGSPIQAFRQKLETFNGGALAIGEQLVFPEAGRAEAAISPADIPFRRKDGRRVHLAEVGGLYHQVCLLLISDLYRPKRVGEIFSEIYPDEYFNPESSPAKVNQLICRTRNWLKEHVPGWTLSRHGRFYSMNFPLEHPVLLKRELLMHQPDRIRISVLYENFGNRDFTTADLATLFNDSTSNLTRYLKSWIESGGVEVIASGPNRAYKLKQSA